MLQDHLERRRGAVSLGRSAMPLMSTVPSAVSHFFHLWAHLHGKSRGETYSSTVRMMVRKSTALDFASY